MPTAQDFYKIIWICILCLFSINCTAQKDIRPNFKLICFIKGSKGKKIILANKPKAGLDPLYKVQYFDSCFSVNDSFKFEFYLKEPSFYSIEIEGKKGWCGFIPTPEKNLKIIGVIDSLYKSKIIGSSEDSLFNILVNEILIPLYTSLSKTSRDSVEFYKNKIKADKYNFIRQNPGSFVSAWNVESGSFNKPDSSELSYLKKCYSALSSKAKQLEISKNTYYNLFIASKKLILKNRIPNFHFINYDDIKFDLYDYIKLDSKKYYLIDFWATWCAPCISQFPKLTEIYSKYKTFGFDIIGFSLDIDKKKYINFLSKEILPWLNVSDLQGSNSLIYKAFKLGVIPANYLLDSNAIIIAIDVKPDELSKILEEKFK